MENEARKKEKIDEMLEMRGRSWLGDRNRGDGVVNMHGEVIGRLVSVLNRLNQTGDRSRRMMGTGSSKTRVQAVATK